MRVRVRLAVMVLAGFALCGVAAAPASAAEPAFFECAKLTGGEFKDKLCSEPGAGKGKFELREGVGASPAVTGKINATGIAGENPESGFEIGCEKSRVLSGRLSSPTSLGGVMIELANCEAGAITCGATVGHHMHVIEIGPLAGPIGYISHESHAVGVDLTPESGSSLAEFRCGGTGPPEYRFKGAIFGALSGDINTFSKRFQLAVGGTLSFEGGAANRLEVEELSTTMTENVRLSGTPWALKVKGAVEIKA